MYRIQDKDTYNFNKTSFIIDRILSQLVITSLERYSRLKRIQLGNYRQVIVIQGINTTRQVILPFIIFTSKYYLSTQYQEHIPYDQCVVISNNSQTTNKLRVAQLQHFIIHIKDYRVGVWQLLILNSYKSYNLLKFQVIYRENKIYTLYILLYLLYLLQLLNIIYFLLLKHMYRDQISSLIQSYINYIIKLKFLLAFYIAYQQLIIRNNIYASF